MSTAIVSRRYATALLDVAEEGGFIDTVTADLEVIGDTVAGSRDLLNMLKSPLLKGDLKARVFKEVFKGMLSEQTLRFIDLLCRKKRAALLAEVIEEYGALRDERNGIVNVDVHSAVELDDEQSKKLINELAAYTGKKVRANLSLDEQLLGGVTVKIGDTILDGSVKHQLEMLRDALRESA
ncbi:F0F1 ATP synthase subunit delta [Prosthecochloris sp. GSB1]|uniref:ATP synthase F1 subunit delta n=1 Tax=Prosthecochloris sp. GSB1 TaxID=281093 RepID=UPI000B8CD8CA|nr:ATP synthase F1 subunit delta [Prosthecochloris sp. GSB1]ASQ91478.1 F0F1 ATP synthase subunit delta [Prosthecochloris sp. GSB1]